MTLPSDDSSTRQSIAKLPNRSVKPLIRLIPVLTASVVIASACIITGADSDQGNAIVHAMDEDGGPVADVSLSAAFAERPTPRSFMTGPDGVAEIIGDEGSWHVSITAPAGYGVDPDQANPFVVRVLRSSPSETTIRLRTQERP